MPNSRCRSWRRLTICAAHGHVEGGHRLVGDDEVGLQGERPGDADALTLTAGERVGMTVGRVFGKSAPFEQGDHLVASGVRRLGLAVDDEWFGDELQHGHPRVQ